LESKVEKLQARPGIETTTLDLSSRSQVPLITQPQQPFLRGTFLPAE